MKLFIGFLALLASSTSLAMPKIADVEFAVNKGSSSSVLQIGSWLTVMHPLALTCVYDFTKQGGAQGTYYLKGIDGQNCVLPKGYIVDQVYLDTVVATGGGGGCQLAFGTGLAINDIKAATGFATYTGILVAVPIGSAATAIKMTSEKSPTVTISGAAVTAGKIVAVIHAFPSL